jgi:hypothetical protein
MVDVYALVPVTVQDSERLPELSMDPETEPPPEVEFRVVFEIFPTTTVPTMVSVKAPDCAGDVSLQVPVQ